MSQISGTNFLRQSVPLRAYFLLALLGIFCSDALAQKATEPNIEILASVDFDGTDAFAPDPDFASNTDGQHTPGLDQNDANNVVRTFDSVGYRVDYNINELPATAVTITSTLPENVTWIEELPPGCGAGSSLSNNDRTLNCILGDKSEGTTGTIFPIARVGQLSNNDILSVSFTASAPEVTAPTVSDTLDVTISATAAWTWVKGEPDILQGVDNGGTLGDVFIFPISIFESSGGRGSEPLPLDSAPINFEDHAYGLPASTQLATGLAIGGRNVCGGYDGTGALPFGDSAAVGANATNTTAGGLAAETITCTPNSTQSTAFGYEVIDINIVDHITSSLAANNADGSANSTGTAIAMQIALWISQADLVDAADNNLDLLNAITAAGTANALVRPSDSRDLPLNLEPIQVAPNLLASVPEFDTLNNFVISVNLSAPPSSPGTRSTRGFARFNPAPFQELEYTVTADTQSAGEEPIGGVYRGYDYRAGNRGGLDRQGFPDITGNSNTTWNGLGGVPRDQELVLSYSTQARASAGDIEVFVNLCAGLDNTFMSVVDFPAFDRFETDGRGRGSRTIGSVEDISASDGLAHVYIGGNGGEVSSQTLPTTLINTPNAPVNYVVEFAEALNPALLSGAGTIINEDELTCNNADAVGNVWTNANDTDAVNLRFDPDGNGEYDNLNLVRVRVLDSTPLLDEDNDTFNAGIAVRLHLSARVKDTVAEAPVDSELYVHTSRAYTESNETTTSPWDPDAELIPDLESDGSEANSCRGNNFVTESSTTGWCGQVYDQDEEGAGLDNNAVETVGGGRRVSNAHHDKVTVIEAQPGIEKVNLAGLTDFVDNGDLITFEIRPFISGATTDTLTNVVVEDVLDSRFELVSFTQPTYDNGIAGTDVCNANGANTTVTCNFDSQVGGFSDSFQITVRVRNITTGQTINNDATIDATDRDQREDRASVFTVPATNELTIRKDVPDLLGNCINEPGVPGGTGGLVVGDCSLVLQDENLVYEISYENTGNTVLSDVKIIDLLPHTLDVSEAQDPTFNGTPASAGDLGDGRTPPSAFSGTTELLSVVGSAVGTVEYTTNTAANVNRDPELDPSTYTATNAGVATTAFRFTQTAGLNPGDVETLTVTIATAGNVNDDIYTNNVGVRTPDIELQARSNDVSIMIFTPLSIGSFVWLDEDQDGLQDSTEPGIAGATVTLLVEDPNNLGTFNPITADALGNPLGPVTTGADGLYSFENLQAGNYRVRVELPAGQDLAPTINQNASDDDVEGDSNINLAATDLPANTFESGTIELTIDGEPVEANTFAGDDQDGAAGSREDENGNMTVDFGFVPPTIGDTVYYDLNGDGVQNPGEAGIPGVTVELTYVDPVDGPQTLTAVTAADGTYLFDEDADGNTLPVGVDYTVTVVESTLPGFNPGTGDNDALTQTVDDDGLATPNTSTTSLTADDLVDLDQDFGYQPRGSIGDLVWFDADGDGVVDSDEEGIAGVTVTLTPPPDIDLGAGLGQPITTVTDANGGYLFPNLPLSGGVNDTQYTVTVDASPGSPLDGLIQTFDDDGVATANTSVTTLSLDNSDPTNPFVTADVDQDFGYTEPVSIGGYLFEDLNADGLQDPGEPAVVGSAVSLLVQDDTGVFVPALDLNGDPVTDVVIGPDGQYIFDNLPGGDYRIRVTEPAGFMPTPVQNTADNDDTANDSNIANVLPGNVYESGTFTLEAGQEPTGANEDQVGDDQDEATGAVADDDSGNMTVDFGFIRPLSVGSLVWEDLNGDGVQDANEPPIAGTVVTLLVEDPASPGAFIPATDLDGVPIASITTGPDGTYLFDNLPPGNYQIEVTPPGSLTPSPVQNPNDDDLPGDSNIAGPSTTPGSFLSNPFELNFGTEPIEPGTDRGDTQDDTGTDVNGNMTIDFGFVPPATIGNFVWLDLDMDGVQDANEEGIPGVEVTLTPPAGVDAGNGPGVPVTVTTGPNGEYLFPNLPPFESADPSEGYVVTVDPATLPAGFAQTYDEGTTPGSLGSLDNSSEPIQLSPLEEHLTADFGYAPPQGSIGDTIWVDANDNGIQDPGEPGIAGVEVTLTPPPDVDAGNGPGVPVTVLTDENGRYLFTDLPLDEAYTVTVNEDTLPDGYAPSASGLGDPDVRDGNSPASEQDGSTVVVLTPEDPVNLDADFGYLPPPDQNNSIGDTIWRDSDGDGNGPNLPSIDGVNNPTVGQGANAEDDASEEGIPGVTVSLIDNVTGTVVATTITDANGQYLFSGLPDGEYTVVVTDQNNVLGDLTPTYDADGTGTAGASIVDLDSAGVSNVPVDDREQDFGYQDANNAGGDGVIGDTIFLDSDNDGAPGAGEGLEGVTVQLFGPGPDGDITTTDDNVLLQSAVTDENGNYLFTGLDTSDTNGSGGTDYQVVVDTTTLPNGGADIANTVDPESTITGVNDSTSVTTLSDAAPEDLDQDFGYRGEANNSLSGTIWADTDGDGTQQEGGIFAGVTVDILDQNGNLVQQVVTDADGNYEVSGLPDGLFTVVVTDENNVLGGFEHTDSPNGTSDTSDQTSKDDTGYVVDLDSAGVSDDPVADATGDFGYEPTITNPISLGTFSATTVGNQVVFRWATQTEVANLGFHLYARVDGEWVRLNAQLIEGQGDSIGVQEYEYQAATDARLFALSDIDLNGDETLHGPFSVDAPVGVIGDRQSIDWQAERAEREAKAADRQARKAAEQRERTKRLMQEMKQRQQEAQQDQETSMNSQDASWLSRGLSKAVMAGLSLMVSSAQAQTESVIEWTNLATTKAGVHEVSYQALVDSGVDLAGLEAGSLRLTNQGEVVPIQVLGGDTIGADTRIRFIAKAIDTLYTNENIYTLSSGESSNSEDTRMAQQVVVPPQGGFATSYLASAKFAPQARYSFTSPDTNDPWYAKRLIALDEPTSDTVTMELNDVALGGNSGSTRAKMSVKVWGASDLPGSNDHRMQIAFNGQTLMDERFDGLQAKSFDMSLEQVDEGANQVTLTLPTQPGVGLDAVNVNEIEVKYPRQFVAQDNRLAFTSQFRQFRVRGFRSETDELDVVVLREDQDGAVTEVTNAQALCRHGNCTVRFGGSGRVANYYVSANPHAASPKAIVDGQDIMSGNANYLIISHPDFIGDAGDNQLEELANELQSEMGSVAIVDVEQIYAQFSGHVFDPTAIQRYIAYAQANRGTSYVLLVGGDVYDYRQFENDEATSFIPSLYAATGSNITFAPVDAKYVDVDDDNVPDLPIGRLPVRTTAQLTALLSKRSDYLNRSYAGTALMVADRYDEVQQYDFASDAQAVAEGYLQSFQVSTAYVDDLGTRGARDALTSQINQGITLTAFFGHSSTNQWSFDGLLTGNDAAQLNNQGKPTVVTQWGCWNAYYVSPNEDSMGHRFMMEGEQGAVAVMGATTLTNANSERVLAQMVFARLANGERLGDAVTNAKRDYAQDNPNDLDVLLGWTVLGMPELQVN